MNERKPQDNSHIITIVVVTLAVVAVSGVETLAACLFFNKEVNVALLTAFVGVVNLALGAIAGVLAKTYATSEPSRPVEGKSPQPEPSNETIL